MMAQFSEFSTTIPINDNGIKTQQQLENGNGPVQGTKAPKMPKQAGGLDRLLDSIGFYGLDRVNYKTLRYILPSEQRKDETAVQLHYACNQCTYKGLTFDHVLVHQACVHPENFFNSLHARIAIMGNNPRYDELKQIFRNLPLRANVDNVFEQCIVLRVSNGNDLKQDSLNDYFLKYGIHGKVQPGNVRCAFCLTPEKEIENIWFHFVDTHPMSPFLAMSSSRDCQMSKNDELSLYEIYYHFFDKICNRPQQISEEHPKEPEVQPLSTEVITEQINEKPQPQSEVVPEQSESVRLEESSKPEASQKDRKRKYEAVEEDKSVKANDSVNVEPEVEAPAPKRSRFDIIRKVARRSANLVGTVAVAVGVYHLSHYLPQSIQTYLE